MLKRWRLGVWLLVLTGCSGSPPPASYSRGVILWHQQQALLPATLDQQIRASYQRLLQFSQSDQPLRITADPTPNAFASVNAEGVASIRLNAGLIDLLGYDLDAIAFVLAHEIGHLTLGHLSAKRRQGLQRQDSAVDVLSTVADILLPFSSLVLLAGSELLKAGYSRDQERDADRYGLELMIQGGFDPQGAVRFQQRLQLLPDSRGLEILSSHPSSAERVERMQGLVEQAAESGS